MSSTRPQAVPERPAPVGTIFILVTTVIVGILGATGLLTAGASTPTVTTSTGVVTHGAIVRRPAAAHADATSRLAGGGR